MVKERKKLRNYEKEEEKFTARFKHIDIYAHLIIKVEEGMNEMMHKFVTLCPVALKLKGAISPLTLNHMAD